MKISKKTPTRRIFVGDNIKQMSNLLIFLTNKKFSVSLVKSRHLHHNNLEEPYYQINIPTIEHEDAFNLGVAYCIENNYDNIICEYPNFDCDTVKNIREREYGLSK